MRKKPITSGPLINLTVVSLILLLIYVSSLVLAGVTIAGVYFFTASDGEKTVFQTGERIYLKACPSAPAGSNFIIEVQLVYPPESARSPITILPKQLMTLKCNDVVVQYTAQEPLGDYAFRVSVYDVASGKLLGQGDVSFRISPPGPPLPPELILAGVLLVLVVALGGFLFLHRRPSTAPPLIAPPTLQPSMAPTGETQTVAPGTIAIKTREGTQVYMGGLQLGDKMIPLKTIPQEFGREDFRGYLPETQLPYISRRHFRIGYDYARNSFVIEDLGSTNGTLVDGEDIRGKGPVPLKDGSIISPAGVVNLRFVVRGPGTVTS